MFRFLLVLLLLNGAVDKTSPQYIEETPEPSCDISTCSGGNSPVVDSVVSLLEPAMEKCLDQETTEEFFMCVAMEKGAVSEDGSIKYEEMGQVVMEIVNALLASNPPTTSNNPFYSGKTIKTNKYSCG
ncbi:unnamed protein product [Allacma fusca]|uniref:Uncharacterized protein n=1 Tax=Allacma fusca TaxID=39272 RepID=A0A8J2LNS1_9HEXA|nr:unnamed protein product [Allacma fusca]